MQYSKTLLNVSFLKLLLNLNLAVPEVRSSKSLIVNIFFAFFDSK